MRVKKASGRLAPGHAPDFTSSMSNSYPGVRDSNRAGTASVAWSSGTWEPRIRAGFAAPLGLACTFGAAAVMSALPSSVAWEWDLGAMSALIVAIGWFSAWKGVLATAGFAWLMFDGFVEDRYGVLRWHGHPDIVRLAVLLGCGAVVAVLREAQIRHRRRAVQNSMEMELQAMAGSARGTLGKRRD